MNNFLLHLKMELKPELSFFLLETSLFHPSYMPMKYMR